MSTMTAEYVAWGVPPDSTEPPHLAARPLYTHDAAGRPIRSRQFADHLAREAVARGASRVRVQCVRMDDQTAGW